MEMWHSPVGSQNGCGVVLHFMKQKKDVQQGTLALMVLKTLEVLGPLHGYGIARRIEQISGDLLFVNQGTLYPVLLRLEQEGAVASEWGPSENNRRARFYRADRRDHCAFL
jgi:PadR family transcriptional regulator, regulatory protein PadR